MNPIKQQKLCEGCTWKPNNTDAQACAFARCVYERTGAIRYTDNYKYTAYRDRLTGRTVEIGAHWYKVNI